MECAESPQVQAYFDGEVDAASAVRIERHVEACPECQSLLQDLKWVRGLLRGPVARVGVPAALRGRIAKALDQEPPDRARGGNRLLAMPRPSRSFWLGVFSGVGGSAVAAVLGFLFLAPLLNSPLPGELAANHIRSLMSAHLIDVVSTDQHTVKPWFAGRTDVSPEVADFARQGYRLLGGRVEVLDHQRAAVLVYQHGPHYINVYSWAIRSGGLPQDTTRNGYHLAFWKVGNLGYCAVSDTGWTELKGLVSRLRDLSAHDTPP